MYVKYKLNYIYLLNLHSKIQGTLHLLIYFKLNHCKISRNRLLLTRIGKWAVRIRKLTTRRLEFINNLSFKTKNRNERE